jgi:hypothetical protein
LRVLFVTMMKGDRSHKFIQDRIKGIFRDDVTQEMADQFQNFQTSLRWNLLLKLVTLVDSTRLFPSIYLFLLGLSYEHHRGTFYLRGIVIWLLHSVADLWKDYVLPRSISLPLFAYAYYISARPIFMPVPPNRIDLVLSAALDYRLARTGRGRLALVPHNTQVGDHITLLKGGKCPFVVRRLRGSHQWILIGDSYVYGMEGEEWREEDCREMEFV